MRSIVVVGGSLAGHSAASALRRLGFDGTLTIVGDEVYHPYQRPPLSKQLLAGEWERAKVDVRLDPKLEGAWRLGTAARRLDVERRVVELADGEALPFDGLVIATGAAPRAMPHLAAHDGVFMLRTVDDALAIRERVERGAASAVIIGAGFIGCEVAATLRRRGLAVTLVDVDTVPMRRGLGEIIGTAMLRMHEGAGVTLALGTGVQALHGRDAVEAVELGDGRRIAADIVVIGIGVAPQVAWLAESGVPLASGVLCDARCAVQGTSGIVAAGDVARWYNPLFEREMRVEHWDNAVAQGAAAARTLIEGASAPAYASVPFFWSDQYDNKLQMVGAPSDGDELVMLEGAVDAHRFTAAFVREGRVTAAFAFNAMHRVPGFKRAVEQRAPVDAVRPQIAAAS